MKPIQCFFYPKGAAHLIAQLELRISELEQANLYLQTKPEAQLRRLQSEREGRKAAHPAHVYDQLILQESIAQFIKANCEFDINRSVGILDLWMAYIKWIDADSQLPDIAMFSLALRNINDLRFNYGRTVTGYTCQGIALRPQTTPLPPSSEEEPKLSDAIFGPGATGPRPVKSQPAIPPHPEEADSFAFAEGPDEHDQAEEEWLSRLPHSPNGESSK